MTKGRRVLLHVVVPVVAIGLVLIICIPLMGRKAEAVQDAAMSHLGRVSMAIMAVGALLLGLLSLVLHRCSERPHPPAHQVFRDEGGTAAIEMLMALPFVVMILLVVLQTAVLWNANVVFHYAGFASARAGTSIIPTDMIDISGERRYWMYNDEDPLTPQSMKKARIRRAAVLALLEISGNLPESAEIRDPEWTGEDARAMVRQALSAAQADTDRPWIDRIAGQFRYADYFTEIEINEPHHWGLSNPGDGCPYRWHRREWGTMDWNYIAVCPGFTHTFDYAPWEEMTARLTYPFELGVPYANRVLAQLGVASPFLVPGSSRQSYYTWMTRETKFMLSG